MNLTQQQALAHACAAYPSSTIIPVAFDATDEEFTFTIKHSEHDATTCFVNPTTGIITEADDLNGKGMEPAV